MMHRVEERAARCRTDKLNRERTTAQGNVNTHLSFAGKLTFYTYDYDEDFGVPAAEKMGVGSVSTGYSYDLTGALKTEVLSNGLTSTYGYDAYGQLTSGAVKRDVPGTKPIEQHKVFEQDLTLLPSGQRDAALEKRYTGTGATTPFSTVNIDWNYDAHNRLTSERRDVNGNTTIDAAGEYLATYTLDAVGNRTQNIVDDFDNAKDETITSSYLNANGSLNRNDWLLSETSVKTTPASTTTTTYGYNTNGSMISKSINGVAAETYTWDLRERMTSATVGVTNYRYDADNNRTQK